MHEDLCVIIENVKNSKLLALFCTLAEKDKDIVINLTESLVKKYKNDVKKITCEYAIDIKREI
jgi:hypothetical protein